MKAYVELIQRKERDLGCDVLTHQKVSTNRHYRLAYTLNHFPSSSAVQDMYGADVPSGPVQTTPTQ